MPTHGNTNRAFRLPDVALWERFGEMAEPDRSEVIRQMIRWYVGEGELPQRPEHQVPVRQD